MELELINNLSLNRSQFLTDLMLGFTSIGGGLISLIVLFILVIFFIYKRKINASILIAASLAFSQILAHILKLIIQRPRPPIGLSVVEEVGYAMPSAHATLAAAFYGMILIQFLKITKNQILRSLLILLFVTIILLIGLSRIYLGVHWPSDVLVGFGLGLIVNISLLILEKPFLKKPLQPSPKKRSR